MEVIATKKGYHIGPRKPGDKFEVPEGTKASWFKPTNAKPAQQANTGKPQSGKPDQGKPDQGKADQLV